MTNFRTQIPIKKERNLIDYTSKILMIGSCFSENIGEKINYFKFNSRVNPFGIFFHPKAIEDFIGNVANERIYTEEAIFSLNEQWHSFEAHSSLSSENKDQLLGKLNAGIRATFSNIYEASHIIFTLGTSWVYRHIESDSIVANCHKVPQKKFLKELMTVEEIVESLEKTLCLIKEINADINIIFTVSPVRHLKDGYTENSRSKAHLITAVQQIIEPRKHIHYFPSYEIMMDDLRDYRFYKSDMLHPNETAISYIWEQFKNTWISEKAFETMLQVDAIQKGLNHKPFNANSEQHQLFLTQLQEKKEELFAKYNISF